MNIITTVLIIGGLLFFAIGTLGVLRMPDFFTRAHAAGKCDSLACVLIIIAVALFNLADPSLANILVSIKILFIAVFVFVASPTATHAITEASLLIGVKPWVKEKKRL